MIEFSRDAVTLWGFAIRWYGILIAIGAAAAIYVLSRREGRYGVPRGTALDLALVCVPAGIVCARIYYVAFSWDYYGAHLNEIFDLRGGGLAIYGGVIGGALAGFVYARIKRIPFLRLADLVAPGIALAQAVGRWGNFLNREAYGAVCDIQSLQFFPMCVRIGEEYRYATFFYESAWCALLCAFLLLCERRRGFARTGDCAIAYVLFYAAERAMVEWLRADSLYIGNLRVSQLLSLAALIACAICAGVRRRDMPVPRRVLPAALAALTAAFVALDAALPAVVAAGMCVLCEGANIASRGERRSVNSD